MFDGLTTFVNALIDLINVLGTNRAILLICFLTIVLSVKSFVDKNQALSNFNNMIKEKNKEIERLADDNRRYREVYLEHIGLSHDDLSKISAKNAVINKEQK